MKKLLVLLTLLAAFASFGCGSDEPAADAPAKAPQVTTKTETTTQVKDKKSDDAFMQKIKDKYGEEGPKIKAKPGDTIHHFSK